MKYDLSIAAICKNEHSYLREWIEYHTIVGVQHFYIYDNESTPPLCNVLEQYKDIVSIISYPGTKKNYVQLSMMNDALQVARDSRWIAFIDVDEFILPRKHDTILEFLDEMDDSKIAGFKFYWQLFGSNRHLLKPLGPQIFSYTRKLPIDHNINKHTKCVVHPDRVISSISPHSFRVKESYMMCDETGNSCSVKFTQECAVRVDAVQINHYWTRSKYEFQQKITRSLESMNIRKMLDFKVIDAACTVPDTEIIDRFGNILKQKLGAV